MGDIVVNNAVDTVYDGDESVYIVEPNNEESVGSAMGSEFVLVVSSSEEFNTIGIIENKYSGSITKYAGQPNVPETKIKFRPSSEIAQTEPPDQTVEKNEETVSPQIKLTAEYKRISDTMKHPYTHKKCAEMEMSINRQSIEIESDSTKERLSLREKTFETKYINDIKTEQSSPTDLSNKKQVLKKRIQINDINNSGINKRRSEADRNEKPKVELVEGSKEIQFNDSTQRSSQAEVPMTNAVINDMKRVSQFLGFEAPLNTNESILGQAQSFALIREKPSRDNAVIVTVSENLVSVDSSERVRVHPSLDSKMEKWEVEPGFTIFKSLRPIPHYNTAKSKISHQPNSLWDKKLKEPQEEGTMQRTCLTEKECREFLSPLEVADLVVTNTINQAKARYVDLINQYGDAHKRVSIMTPEITSGHWSSIKKITKEGGIALIEQYIVAESDFEEDWKYTIFYEGAQSDLVSDYFFYVVHFSLPSRMYPIAQASASLYFRMEISRVIPPQCPVKVDFRIEGCRHKINPTRYILRDEALLRVLDIKLKFFKELSY